MKKTVRSEVVSRRQFLRTTATVAAVSLASVSVERFAHAAVSDALRVGLIGAGGRNTGAGVQALRADPGARLVAICDIFMDRVKSAREHIRAELAKDGRADAVQVPDVHCFTGFDAYREVIVLSDVVCIANAAKFHPLHALAALEAGKHLFVEKPHGIDPYTVKLMRRTCDLARERLPTPRGSGCVRRDSRRFLLGRCGPYPQRDRVETNVREPVPARRMRGGRLTLLEKNLAGGVLTASAVSLSGSVDSPPVMGSSARASLVR